MGGFDDHVAILGEWPPPSPSPRAFFSSLLGDDVVVRSESISENRNVSLFPGPERQVGSEILEEKQAKVVGDEASQSNAMPESNMSSRGRLLERVAARTGFSAPRLNTDSIRPGLSQKSEIHSPYLTIPPGLSPTSLLESPVFLSNSLVVPSPTTGKFLFAPSSNGRDSTLISENPDNGKEIIFEDNTSFAFRPGTESDSLLYFGASRVNPSTLSQQSFPGKDVSVHSENLQLPHRVEQSVGFLEHSPPFDEPQEEDADQKGGGDPEIGSGPAEDGYNWRKYGQKQVKGSEYPRSYYKCTHPNCPVKKKVERSYEGHITEIVYKGAHNHPKPPSNLRSIVGSSNDMQLDSNERHGTGESIFSTMQRGASEGAPDWRQDNIEAAASAPPGQDYGDGAISLQAQNGTRYGSADGANGSSTFSNDENEDDRETHGSVSLGYEGEGDESESKRRRTETYAPEIGGHRAIREPRVVVQTTSEVDILDDGYRWRKYGQKVVKGNPNPRSYYKCTSPGCTVRKHVERASHDLKSVITTYEGKHNHDVPSARNSSSNINSGVSNTQPSQASSHNIHRSEPSQFHSSITRFERPSLGSFGLPGRPQPGPAAGFGYGMNHPGLAHLAMSGLGPNQSNLPVLPVNPYVGQSPPMNDMAFVIPKGEPKVEPLSDTSSLKW